MEQERLRQILTDCMNVQPGEEVLIVTDGPKEAIGQALYEAAASLGADAILMKMVERQISGEEPPAAVAAAMCVAKVVLAPTEHSLTHTNARIAASKAGARMATMPGITEEMFTAGAMCADYREVERLTLQVTELLTKAQTATIRKQGHTLQLDLRGRAGVPSTGVYRKPGQAGNLPSGESYIAPVETGSTGSMLIDGSMVGVGVLESPLTVTLREGRLCAVEGKQAEPLRFLLEDTHRATLGELGIGTNRAARLTGVILEDEKVYGTVHIAFGTNTSFGGVNKADCHLDGIILKPDLWLDEQQILADGAFCI